MCLMLNGSQDGHCLTPSLCVGLSDETGGKECPEAKDSNGEKLILVCCTDVLKNEATVSVPMGVLLSFDCRIFCHK